MKRSLIVAGVAAILLLFGLAAYADSNNGNVVYTTVTVEDNDTLWSIASKHVNDDTDIRAYIYEVEQLNGIKSPGDITPGQQIKLPAK